MSQNYNKFIKLFENKKLPMIIGLAGVERSLIFKALDMLKKNAFEKILDFNFNCFDADKVNIDDIIISANTIPLLSSKRFIEVRNAEKINIFNFKKIENYFKNPNPTTCLVFIFEVEMNLKNKIMLYLNKKSLLFNFMHPKNYEMHSIIIINAKKKGLKLQADAALALSLIINNNLTLLDNVLEKLKTATNCDKINVNNIIEHVANYSLQNIFELGRFVAIGNKEKALSSICLLRLDREIPLRIVGMLAWQFRLILKVRSMLDEGFSEFDIEKEFSLFGDNKKNVFSIAKKGSIAMHISKLSKLSILDSKLKESLVPAWFLLEKMIFELC